jgi:hypothetical protein
MSQSWTGFAADLFNAASHANRPAHLNKSVRAHVKRMCRHQIGGSGNTLKPGNKPGEVEILSRRHARGPHPDSGIAAHMQITLYQAAPTVPWL